jgi:ATP-dependent RNA helicase DeaD
MRRLERFINAPITRRELPTREEILNHRTEALMADMTKWLNRDRCKQELLLVNDLVQQGHDPLMVAAVALKMARAQERQRPIWDISEVKEAKPRRERAEGRDRRPDRKDSRDSHRKGDRRGDKFEAASTESHEAGMIRVRLNVGKRHNARPRDVVGMLAYQADIPGSEIGKIFIEEKHTLVDVPEQRLQDVLKQSGQIKMHKYQVEIKTA